MKNTTPIKDRDIKFTVTIPLKVARGHQPHRSGAGAHKHRNDKRLGTRSQRTKQAVSEF